MQVAGDGSLGWVISRVKVRRTKRDPEQGSDEAVQELRLVYAGIATYEKHDGQSVRTANERRHVPGAVVCRSPRCRSRRGSGSARPLPLSGHEAEPGSTKKRVWQVWRATDAFDAAVGLLDHPGQPDQHPPATAQQR